MQKIIHKYALVGCVLIAACNKDKCFFHENWCTNPLSTLKITNLGENSRLDPTQITDVKYSLDENTFDPNEYQVIFNIQQQTNYYKSYSPGALKPVGSIKTTELSLDKLRCGSALMHLYLQPIETSAGPPPITPADMDGSPLLPFDPSTKLYYRQHGSAKFIVVDTSKPRFDTGPTGDLTIIPNPTKLISLGIHNMSKPYILANYFGNTDVTAGLVLTDINRNKPTLAANDYFIGTSNQRALEVHFARMPPSIFIKLCTINEQASTLQSVCMSSAMLANWTTSTALDILSAAIDPNNEYFAAVDGIGELHIYSLPIGNAPVQNEIDIKWPKGTYRYVLIGDLDGNGTSDVLALRSGASPVVLLRDGSANTLTFKESREIEDSLGKITELQTPTAFAWIGHLNCQEQVGLVFGSGMSGDGTLKVLFQNPTNSFVQQDLTLPALAVAAPAALTAVTLADLNQDGRDDLVVAMSPNPQCMSQCKPNKIYIYYASAKPGL